MNPENPIDTEENQQVADEEVVEIEDSLDTEIPPSHKTDVTPQPPVERFEDLHTLHPKLMHQINQIKWTAPTPVQGLCLPYTLKGRDVAGFAQTGTGKTGVFLITIANHILHKQEANGPQDDLGFPTAVILAPTRELAMQIDGDAQNILEPLGIRSMAVFGGVDYEKQASQIKKGVDVIVATPGRLKDYFQKGVFKLRSCGIFVCDEADRMFDMGFIEDVEYFLEKLDEKAQKLLFSATTNEQVKELAFEYLETPEYISVNPEVITPERIEQHSIICESRHKLKVMLGLLQDHKPSCAIIFTNTKLVAEWLHYKLANNGIEVDVITGDLPQKKRIALIHKIKAGSLKVLIATDVASRGLHIAGVTHVYNFDLPDEAANYVHRIGRTARAGAKGQSWSLVCEDYGQNLAPINQLLGETAAVTSFWYDPRYLEIEDKSGNPYKDPNFKGNTMTRTLDRSGGEKSPRRPERDGQGGGRRGGRDGESGRDDQKAHGKKSSGPRGERRPERGDRGDRKGGNGRTAEGGRGPRQGRDQKQPQSQQARGFKDRRYTRPQQTLSTATPLKSGEQSTSFFGLIKRMFGALFKSKN